MTIWKPWPKNERFMVSDDGRVQRDGKELNQFKTGKYGYLGVSVRGEPTRVHIMVLEAFVGPRPNKKLQCAHMDGDRYNNRPSNLKWVTAKENVAHKKIHGTQLAGSRHQNAKLSAAQVSEIRASYIPPSHGNARALSEKYKISRTTLKYILRGKSYV